MPKLTQHERFQQAKESLLSKKDIILPLGTDVALNKEKPSDSPILMLIQEALKPHGFLVEIFFDNTNFLAMVSDSEYENSKGGVLATQILSVPYEYAYMLLPNIFTYFEKSNELR